ncbi:MAG TPA: glycosyl hydrolase-related protein, partial [Chloroflexota bacterium]|nr:glycosyl hydrolase-related protein [Chloroflexota bacterium]
VILSACKRTEAPDEESGEPGGTLVLRLYNPTDQEQPARIRLRGGIGYARYANILEEPDEELPLQDEALALLLPAKKIVTLLVQSACGEESGQPGQGYAAR